MAANSSAMYLVSLPNGKILWANRSFLDWSRYTLHEIISMSWVDLSAKDEGLQADLGEVLLLDQYSVSYSVQKRYIPKGSSPQLGNLHVTRYPPAGDIEFCWCRWEPLYNGTAKAFEQSLKHHSEVSVAITKLSGQVQSMLNETVEEKAFSSVILLAQKYPKLAWGAVVLIVASFIGNNAVSILHNTGLLGPIKVVETKP